MHRARWLTHLLFASLLLSATLARAQQTPPPEAISPGDATEQLTPPQPDAEVQTSEDDEDSRGPTWFGMGFESRRDRFRRDMGTTPAPPGGGSGAGGSRGNGGNGFGR